jgi:flagellar L-ring protein precursor FlgH
MKLILILIILSFGFTELDAQFIQNSSQSLFSDVKAFKEGDALTVLITEDVQANGNSSMDNGRSTDVGFSANMGLNALGSLNGSAGAGHDNDFKSSGNTSRNERIRTQLSVRVTGVEPNGNLEIEGTRTTKINGETQTIVIKGVVRLVDILPNNSIYSYSILDLTLLIDGDGQISEIHEPGLITKFIRFLF